MSGAIPTSTSVTESAVIKAPLAHVWHHIKLESFQDFWSAISKSEFVKGASPDTDIVKWTFKDGTVLEVKQEEHSVSPRRRHQGGRRARVTSTGMH
jgi:ATP-dependent DNA ligase